MKTAEQIYRRRTGLSILSLLMIVFLAGCSDSAPTMEGEEPEEPGDPVNTERFYPDNYLQWASFSDRARWGPYNVHDPNCMDDGEWTYCFSTDVAYGGIDRVGIQVRRSQDLVHWEFHGWAFNGIPDEAYEYVAAYNSEPPSNIWAPYIMKQGDTYRLYYSVSVFGSGASYIGLATSSSLDGPWTQQGAVITSTHEQDFNAIDPTVVVDRETGRHWMAYGSYWSGLYMLELDPETGKPIEGGTRGHRIAARSGSSMEAPELIYHQPTDQYYLFVSYGSLYDRYNVRVGRADKPSGPYLDFNGNDMAEDTDNRPLLTAPYEFNNHSGWQGVGHPGVFKEENQYFMMHQGRLGSNPDMMVMHLRRLTWTEDGWPVASPERYGAIEQMEIRSDSITGQWEQITLRSFENADYKSRSETVTYNTDGTIGESGTTWSLDGRSLHLTTAGGTRRTLYLSHGYDWENNKVTIVYTGLTAEGRTVWGKRVTLN